MREPKVFDESFMAPLHRHVINLMCLDSGPEARKKFGGQCAVYNFSAFVAEIENRWFAISAGHIFRDLKTAIAAGAKISDWQIDDSIVSEQPQHAYPIALDIDQDVLFFYDDVPGLDYACFEFNQLTRQALEKEGITAIPRSLWDAEDVGDYGLWLLIGTPSVFSQLAAGKPIVKHHASIRVERVHTLPKGLDDTEFKRLYARIDFDSVMDQDGMFNIEGMSGGPIFGISPGTEQMPYEYRLIGVQSKWNKRDHVAICAAQPFLHAVSERIR